MASDASKGTAVPRVVTVRRSPGGLVDPGLRGLNLPLSFPVTRLSDLRARVHPTYRASHRRLLAPLDIDRWAKYGAAPGAVVVPTARGASETRSGLRFAAHIAAKVQAPLVVLASKDAATSESLDKMREQIEECPPGDALVIRVSDSPTSLTAFDVDSLRISTENRRGASAPGGRVDVNDVGRKRNLAVLLARTMSWSSLLLLDDDVFVDEDGQGRARPRHSRTLDVKELHAAVGAVSQGACAAVGWTLRDFDDNSVLFRIRREMGRKQSQFIGGGALLLGVADDTPFFPSIYNEDWLFLLALLRGNWSEAPWMEGGDIHQDAYQAYTPTRAAAEELGDLLGEGLLALVERRRPRLSTGDHDHWRRAILNRAALAQSLLKKVEGSQHPHRSEMLEALKATRSVQGRLVSDAARWAARITNYVTTWEADLGSWRERLVRAAAMAPEDLLTSREFVAGSAEVVHGGTWRDFVRTHVG